eukprot:4770224-Amphidinium_carterae.1
MFKRYCKEQKEHKTPKVKPRASLNEVLHCEPLVQLWTSAARILGLRSSRIRTQEVHSVLHPASL